MVGRCASICKGVFGYEMGGGGSLHAGHHFNTAIGFHFIKLLCENGAFFLGGVSVCIENGFPGVIKVTL